MPQVTEVELDANKCAKCGHSNSPGRNRCKSCGSHLYVQCPECSKGNRRSEKRCTDCGHPLHRSFAKRVAKRLGNHRKIKPLEIGLLIVAIVVAYKVIVYVAQTFESFRPPADV